MEVTQAEVAARLEGFLLTVRRGAGGIRLNGEVDDPQAVAQVLFAEIAAARARDGVTGARVCCERAGGAPGPFTDPEVAAMAALAPVVDLVRGLGHDARTRVLEWARCRAHAGLPPFLQTAPGRATPAAGGLTPKGDTMRLGEYGCVR